MVGSKPSRYAHFEKVEPSELLSLYERHGEVARDIHQDILRRFTGNDELTVDLVRNSPLKPDDETFEKLGQYDVVSVSTEIGFGSILHSRGIANANNVLSYMRQFEEEDMPIYVALAGNSGKTYQLAQPRVADLARNSLVVGEANNNEGGQAYIEDHSSKINPTLASDNPFNRGNKYQYYNVSPSLEGHEDLIRDWIIEREAKIAFNMIDVSNLDDRDRQKLYDDIFSAKYKKYTQTQEGIDWVQKKLDGYMANPETLHALVMAEIRENRDVDENGFATDIDGTSFSSPELAGYVSGAMYEQEQREENNLPILTKEEITTLVKMATIDTTMREGEDLPMDQYINSEGHKFVFGAGHGVFQPDMFRKLLDKAYEIIETNPDINRDPVTKVMRGDIIKGQIASKPVMMMSGDETNEAMIIDRIRIDVAYDVSRRFPHYIKVSGLDEDEVTFRMQTANIKGTSEYLSWVRIENQFGEELPSDKTLDIRLAYGETSILKDAQVTVYGYNKDGLMDQMIDYSKKLVADTAPRAELEPEPDIRPSAVNNGLNLMF